MPPRRRRLSTIIVTITGALLTNAPAAQTPARMESTASASISGVYQFDADLDSGGNAGAAGLIFNGTYRRDVTRELGLGVTLRYDYENWRFSNPVAFQGENPWQDINALSLGLSLDYAYASDLRFGISPVFGWSYEIGAPPSKGLDYGGIASVTKIFSPRLVLGGGIGAFRQIDETKVFPFLVVQWQIDDRWRLANPFRAGPAGGTGLELAYAVDDNWEIAGGGARRSYRFRLDDDGIAPGGIGKHRYFPIFARVSRKLGATAKLEFYAGVSARGRLTVTDTAGNDTDADYESAPALGLTLSYRL